MELLITFIIFILSVNCHSDEQWENFKKTHNKSYKSDVEEKLRYNIFRHNLLKIIEHNIKFEIGESTYAMGVNKFADWTSKEFLSYLNFQIPNMAYIKTFNIQQDFNPPDTVDWREKGAVLEVKNQGSCGSCWAFSTTGSLEAQNIIKHNKTISLSEQELVDCSRQFGNQGCDGGWMQQGYNYTIGYGIAAEDDYPYDGYERRCKQATTARTDIKVTGYVDVEQTEVALAQAVASVGPISAAMNALLIQHYSSGIFDEPSCSQVPDHGVLVVGYGSESNTDYWLIKNSWGTDWGDKGYFKLVRNKNSQCGIGEYSTYPIIE